MKNKLVRKSNALVEASYKLYASEKRVILFLSSMIRPEDKDFKSYKLSIKEFANISGLKHKGEYAQVREITRRLISRVLEIDTPTGLLQTSWLSSAEYVEGSGEVILQFDSKLKPFLLQLKERFTRYNLEQAIRLKSIYSIRIYELLKQYEKIGQRMVLLNDLRHILGLEEGQYRNFNSFKVYVLSSSQEELAEKTDITFDFEEIKVGRKVGKIRFYIKSKGLNSQQITSAVEILATDTQGALTRLLGMLPKEYKNQVSIKKLLSEALAQKDYEYVARNITYTNKNSLAANSKAANTGGNYRNYLAKALKNDFGLAYQEDQDALKAKEKAALEEKKAELIAKQKEQEKKEKEDNLRSKAREILKAMTPEEFQAIETEAISNLAPKIQKKALEKHFSVKVVVKRAIEKIVVEKHLSHTDEKIENQIMP